MNNLIEIAMRHGAHRAAVIETDKIPFNPELREMCRLNQCGGYGKNWTCPPDIGEVETLIEKARSYKYALVYQTVWTIEDSFDYEGMVKAKNGHGVVTENLITELKPELPRGYLLLSAGGCSICEKCTKPDGLPCRFPERAISSLEAYGIFVSELAKACDMKYINGINTVTYFGAFFYTPNAT